MQRRELRRNPRGGPTTLTPTVALLIGGAVVLLLASLAIVFWSARRAAVTGVGPAATATVPAVAAAPPTTTPVPTIPATVTPRPPTATAARPTTAPTRPPSPAPARASATPGRPLAVHGGCRVALPPGFGEETPQGGYYPALDRTGFAALDAFDTANGRRTPEELAQSFAATTLSQVIQGYQQTGAERTGSGYRIDYVATAEGQPGRGSFFLKEFGPLACGVTLFALDRSPTPLAPSFDEMVLSLTPAPTTGAGTATPQR